MKNDNDDTPKGPAHTYDLGSYLRARVRPVVHMDEPTLQRLTGELSSLRDLDWSHEHLCRWISWLAAKVSTNPAVKNPAAVLVTEVSKGDPGDLPAPTGFRGAPSGQALKNDEQFNSHQDAMRSARILDRAYEPPIQLVQVLGRRSGDYQAAYYEAAAEHERQGKPAPWEMDLSKFGSGADLDAIKVWQREKKEEEDKRVAKYGVKR